MFATVKQASFPHLSSPHVLTDKLSKSAAGGIMHCDLCQVKAK